MATGQLPAGLRRVIVPAGVILVVIFSLTATFQLNSPVGPCIGTAGSRSNFLAKSKEWHAPEPDGRLIVTETRRSGGSELCTLIAAL